MLPLKTPAKNTEQKIFKFVLFIILPLMAVLTVYSFVTINSKKNDAAENRVHIQSGNANKRITIFFDPISRDIGYLQTLGNAGKLNLQKPGEVRADLELFSKSHLQHVRRVIFWDGKKTSVYVINEGICTNAEEITSSDHINFLNEARDNANFNKIDWDEGIAESSIMAAMVFKNPDSKKSHTVATDIDATTFFDGLKDHMAGHLFLLSNVSDQLPRQFVFTEEGKPVIEETNDPVILAAYTQWKSNAAENPETTHRMIFDGKPWWVSIRQLQIKDGQLYSGLILAEAQMFSEFFKGRRTFAMTSLISFVIVLIATVFLWRRYQRDIEQSALPPALNKMTSEKVLQAIAAGEDDRLEFKSTLRWNLRTNKPDKAMEIACLKTIAAFLNSEGGTLLVGVEDDGNILGIAADQFPNEDKFLLHFNNLINQHLGLEMTDSFSFDIRHLDSGDILIVDCMPSPAPVYVTHDRKEEFYVRVGPGTRPLTTRDALEYIRNHF